MQSDSMDKMNSKENSDYGNQGPPGLLAPAKLDSFRTPPKGKGGKGAAQEMSNLQNDECSDRGWLPLYAPPKSKLSPFSTEARFGVDSDHYSAPTPPSSAPPLLSMGPLVASSPVFDGPSGRWGPVGGKTPSKIKVDFPTSAFKSICRPIDVLTMSCLERHCSQMSDLDGSVYEVRFKRSCRYFLRSKRESLAAAHIQIGSYVNVEADRGLDVGMLVSVTPLTEFVALSAKTTAGEGRIRHDEKRLLRVSSKDETSRLKEKSIQEDGVVEYIQNLCKQRDMPLTIVDAEFQYDNAKLTVFYEATTYVVFQQLVREVYKVYKTRIWLEQIGGPGILGRGPRDSLFCATNHRSILSSDAPIFSQQPGPYSAEQSRFLAIVTPERAEEPGLAATAMAAGMAAQANASTAYRSRSECSSPASAESLASISSPMLKAAEVQGIFSQTFICPITQDMMVDPVICSDGHTYDRAAIVAWLKHSRVSPKTQSPLSNNELKPNDSLRIQIEKFREIRLEERLKRLSIPRE